MRRRIGLASLLIAVAAVAACAIQTAPAAATGGGSSSLGTGVTAHTVKVGVALVDFSCIEQFVNQIRIDQDQVYEAFIRYVNTHGGIAGRKIVPDFQYYCPIQDGPALALCTQFTEDAHVFMVMGDFVDFSGDAQTCIANDHHTVLMTFDLTQAVMNQSPPGLIILPGQTPERTDVVLLNLLERQRLLKGKKVAVLSESDNQSVLDDSLLPALEKTGVAMGSTAILDITGADTSAAQTQLDSFIARWKTENVNALFVSGTEVASQQFIANVRQQMPSVMLISDDNATDVMGFGREEQEIGIRPNPYQGILLAGGPTPQEYDQSSNWKFCASVYKKETGKVAPNAVAVVPGPDGKTLDTYGSINDACQLLLEFQQIGDRVGKNLNNANWVRTVNDYGPIRDYGAGQYASLHAGKYDDNDTFRLEEFVSSIGPEGSLKALTPLEDVPAS